MFKLVIKTLGPDWYSRLKYWIWIRIPKPMDPDPEPIESDPEPIESDPEPIESDPEPIESDPKPIESDPEPMNPDPKHWKKFYNINFLCLENSEEEGLAGGLVSKSGHAGEL